MRIDPRHLKVVLAIVEHGTFNKAAEALCQSQPALSKSISLLEHSLGAKVFDRGTKGSTLTEAGRIIARSAQNVEMTIRRAQAEVSARANHSHGPLVIGATPSTMLGLVPHALGRLSEMYRSMSATVYEGMDLQLQEFLDRGEIDLLVGPVGGLRPLDNRFVETTLAKEAFLIGLSPGHRLAGSAQISLQELADEAWILPTPGSSFHQVVEALFLASGTPLPQNCIASNSLHAQESIALWSNRVFLLTPAQLIGRNVAYQVCALTGAPTRSIGIRRIAHMTLSPLADAFIMCLQDGVKTLMPEGLGAGAQSPIQQASHALASLCSV